MVASVKRQEALRMPTAGEWDERARKFSRRSIVNGSAWSLADIFKGCPGAKEHFIQLCKKGCNPEWLATALMRLPVWGSGKAGRKPFGVDARQKHVLKRVQKDLKQMLEWKESFPMLVEPGAGETLFFKTRDFEAALSVALDGLSTNHLTGFTATNAQALAASETVRKIKRKTRRSHFASVLILFDAVLSAEGRTDLFNSEDKLKKIVKRYTRKNSK